MRSNFVLLLEFMLTLVMADSQIMLRVVEDSIKTHVKSFYRDEIACIPSNVSGQPQILLKFALTLCNLGNDELEIDPQESLLIQLYGEDSSGFNLLGKTNTQFPYLRDSVCIDNKPLHFYHGTRYKLSANCCCRFPDVIPCQWVNLGNFGEFDFSNYSLVELQITFLEETTSLVLKNGPLLPEYLEIHFDNHRMTWDPLYLILGCLLAFVLYNYISTQRKLNTKHKSVQ